MSKEPEWIEHDGSYACPVNSKNSIEVKYKSGHVERDSSADTRSWTAITHYRDWTAWEQQQASAEVPDEAFGLLREAAVKIRDCQGAKVAKGYGRFILARIDAFLAAHEQPPVDPLMRIAKSMAAEVAIHGSDLTTANIVGMLRAHLPAEALDALARNAARGKGVSDAELARFDDFEEPR